VRYSEIRVYIPKGEEHMLPVEEMLPPYYEGGREVALDLGAHVGTRALWLATDGGFEKVYAVECNAKNFHSLVRNVEVNQLQGKVIPILAAVADKPAILRLTHTGVNSGQSSLFYSSDRERDIAYFVSAISLVDLLAELPERPDFIKMDIEGAEYPILSSWASLANAFSSVRVMFLEIHAPCPEVISPLWLEALGYNAEDPQKQMRENLKSLGFTRLLETPKGQIIASRG
jgi:FkbM family methyltransferase